MDSSTARPEDGPDLRGAAQPRPASATLTLKPLVPAMRWLLYTAAALVFLAGFQLFVFTSHTATYFAWTIANPLAAAFIGAAYWAAVVIEALAARQTIWANARISVPAVLAFTVLTLIVTLLNLDKFHFGAKFATGTQFVTWAWIAIYSLVPLLLLILLVRQAREPGTDPPRSAPLPRWLYALLGLQAIVLAGFGVALLTAPGQTASLWPWKLTTIGAQATAAWLIALAVAAAHALIERDARRLLPASAGYVLLGILEYVALARYPQQFSWGSAPGVIYLVFLATILLSGAAGLACVRRPSSRSAGTGRGTTTSLFPG